MACQLDCRLGSLQLSGLVSTYRHERTHWNSNPGSLKGPSPAATARHAIQLVGGEPCADGLRVVRGTDRVLPLLAVPRTCTYRSARSRGNLGLVSGIGRAERACWLASQQDACAPKAGLHPAIEFCLSQRVLTSLLLTWQALVQAGQASSTARKQKSLDPRLQVKWEAGGHTHQSDARTQRGTPRCAAARHVQLEPHTRHSSKPEAAEAGRGR